MALFDSLTAPPSRIDASTSDVDGYISLGRLVGVRHRCCSVHQGLQRGAPPAWPLRSPTRIKCSGQVVPKYSCITDYPSWSCGAGGTVFLTVPPDLAADRQSASRLKCHAVVPSEQETSRPMGPRELRGNRPGKAKLHTERCLKVQAAEHVPFHGKEIHRRPGTTPTQANLLWLAKCEPHRVRRAAPPSAANDASRVCAPTRTARCTVRLLRRCIRSWHQESIRWPYSTQTYG